MLTQYKDYQVIRRDGYVVVRVTTYPCEISKGMRQVIHYLPSTLIPAKETTK